MISIIDYGAGNIGSVKRAFEKLKEEVNIVRTKSEILKAEVLVLPGVGSFGFFMEQLRKRGLEEPIKNAIESGKPFLGICVGLQILFERSEESPGIKGIAIFKGSVNKFRKGKVPQIGWNCIIPKKKGLFKEEFFYFVNSYYAVPNDKNIIASITSYEIEFASGIQYKNITAVQFHPEKSGDAGIKFLKRWLKC